MQKLCHNSKSTRVKVLENEQKQTDCIRECIFTWRKGDGAVLISVAFGLRLSATVSVHRLVENKRKTCLRLAGKTRKLKLNAEESEGIT